jgi:chitinase
MRIHLIFALVGVMFFGACKEEPQPPADCRESQPPPVAQAGNDQTVRPGARVVLDGADSTSPGEGGLTYRWTLSNIPTGSTASFSDDTLVNPAFTADVAGRYVATLIVTDNCQPSSPDSVIVTAEPPPPPPPPEDLRPVARPGSSSEVTVGTAVELDGSASSDPEGHALTFAWSFAGVPTGSTAALSNPAAVNPAFTPDLAGAYVLRLVVSDRTLQSEPAFVIITARSAGPVVPIARPGSARTVLSRKPVALDGSASSDPNGDPLTFTWSFTSVPSGSTAALVEPASATPSFIPDLEGAYVIRLVVNDGVHESVPATVTVTAENGVPVANAGADAVALLGSVVRLQGQGSDANGDTLTFSWTITQKPTGSGSTLSGGDTPTPSFTPDLQGNYTLSLVVHDGRAASAADTVVVQAQPPTVTLLNHRVIDAEYSKALDRVVMVTDNPNALYLYDPMSRTETSVALPAAPTSVSVGPDGLFAAVGHDANVSYVDLSTPRLVRTWPVTTHVFDIVLAANGFAYAFPSSDQWVSIHCLNLATGAETMSGGWSVRAGTRARLHPGGTSIYGANNGLSPDDIEKYGISNGTAQVLYDSPYHGDYSMCGNLWFSEDGARIFTACGNTFRSSEVRSEDMRYAGALSGAGYIRHLTHSTRADRIALVQGSTDPVVASKVRLYTPDFLAFDRSIQLPPYVRNSTSYPSHGRFVFYNSTGDRMIVVVQIDASSGLLNDYGVVTF